MGETLLHNEDGCAVFRSATGWQILLYNHHHYANPEATWETFEGVQEMIGDGTPRPFALALANLPARVQVTRRRVDQNHGWALPAWQEMGSPDWPTPAQLGKLHEASQPLLTEHVETTQNGILDVTDVLPPLAFQLIEIREVKD